MAKRDAAGWSICSQISAPADDPYFFVKPAGTYACILLRGYDFTASQSISVKKQIEALPLKICGNAYESDVSLFSSHAGRGYMTEISIQVERPPRS